MFLHETAESREVCGYTGNAHHSTLSCRKKQAKRVSGQYTCIGFTSREKKTKNKPKQADRNSLNTKAALKTSSESYNNILLWIMGKNIKRNFKDKIHPVFANIHLSFRAAKLKTFWECSFETENPNIWSGLFGF